MKNKKILWTLSFVLSVIVVILLILQFSLKNQVTNFKTLNVADEYFIEKNYDSAWHYYDQLDLSVFENDLLEKRKSWMELNLEMNAVSFLSDSIKLEMLNQLQACELFEKTDENISDKEIVLSLLSCYSLKSSLFYEKKKNTQNIFNTGFLMFKNHNNLSVYYLGEMEDSLAKGNGIGLYSNESYYKGEWENNKRNGEGRFETNKGELYIGTYKDDKRNGHGTYWFRNGDYYEGEWKESKRNGIGGVFSPKGDTIVYGVWKNDRLDRSSTREMNGQN